MDLDNKTLDYVGEKDQDDVGAPVHTPTACRNFDMFIFSCNTYLLVLHMSPIPQIFVGVSKVKICVPSVLSNY